MAALAGPIIGGIGGLISGLLPGGPTVTNQNQQSNGWQDVNSNANTYSNFNQQLQSLLESLSHTAGGGTSTSTSTPNLSPQTQALIDSLTKKYQNLTTPSLTGYEAQQTQGINRNADLQQQAIQQMMASRGLSSSPVSGTAAAGVDAQRFGAINNMQAGIPLLQNQLNRENLNSAAQFMGMIPHGTTTTGATTNVQDVINNQNQSQNTSGSNVGGQTNWTGSASGSNVNSTSSQQQKGSPAAGIAGLLAGLFSDERLKKDIKPIDKAVDKIMSLRPSSWKWKGGEVEDSGLLAQDVLKKLPELVDKTDDSGFMRVNYAGLIGTLVGAIQELAVEGR